MLDRTRRLVSGAVDLAKDVVGPGKKAEEGRAALDAFADGLDAHLGDLRFALRGRRSVPRSGCTSRWCRRLGMRPGRR
jgi:hypothetical protein